MLQQRVIIQSPLKSALVTLELVFHETVQRVRQQDGNAMWAIGKSLLQNLMMIAVFYVMFEVLGLRTVAIRGHYILYVMSGIFMYMTHVRAMGSVMSAQASTSGMMMHGPMNTFIALASGALSALYLQAFSTAVILFIAHTLLEPINIYHPFGAMGMMLLAWASGVSVGLVLYALNPWLPNLVPIVKVLYTRVNMIASGKMFVANMLPPMMLNLFDWNPLFHIVDQGRGELFINYFPRNSSMEYPIYVMTVFFAIGLMLEFFTRKNASASWGARR